MVATGGATDLRTGGYLCGAPEVALLDMVCLSMSTHFGLPSMGSGISTEAKAANFQAGAEGAITAVATVLAGADMLVSAGLLDSVQAISTAKVVLDCDTIGAVRRLLRLPGGGRRIGAARRHRRGRPRWPLPRPQELSRRLATRRDLAPVGVPAREPLEFAGRSLVSDALERAEAVLAAHVPTPIPDDARREARAAFERYARGAGADTR